MKMKRLDRAAEALPAAPIETAIASPIAESRVRMGLLLFRARYRPPPPIPGEGDVACSGAAYAPRRELPMRRKRAKMRRKRANESGVTLGGLVTPLKLILVVGGPLMRINLVSSSYPGSLRHINSS